jgi:hypothetical protein
MDQINEHLVGIPSVRLTLPVKVYHVDHGKVSGIQVQATEILEPVLGAAFLGGIVEIQGRLAIGGQNGGEGDVAANQNNA